MNKIIILITFMLPVVITGLLGKVSAAYDALVLARVVYTNLETLKDLPVHALLHDEQGNDYALVLARLSQLEKCRAKVEILDGEAARADYWLVRTRHSNAKPPAFGRWLYHDGLTGVIRIDKRTESISRAWQSAGYDLFPLPDEPLVLDLAQGAALAVGDYEPNIADMISQVDADEVYTLTGQLAGNWPAVIGGSSYTFTTRNTRNAAAIQKATQFAYEYMQSRNFSPVYQNWSGCPSRYPTSSRNVIGELPGNLAARQIVLVTAHIDDMPSSGLAPGADDNASGTVGVLMAASILSQYEFERTIRFVIFTGEEQGMCGSRAYAGQVESLDEDIVAVLNLDMIAYDSIGEPVLGLHTRGNVQNPNSQDLAIANAFINVVNDYGLDNDISAQVVADAEPYSDHASFWNYGFPGILAIEDYSDFTPYYHTSNDALSTLNQTYYVNVVRAVVGTSATLALLHEEDNELIFIPLVINTTFD